MDAGIYLKKSKWALDDIHDFFNGINPLPPISFVVSSISPN